MNTVTATAGVPRTAEGPEAGAGAESDAGPFRRVCPGSMGGRPPGGCAS